MVDIINVSDIIKNVKSTFDAGEDFEQFTITRGEPINTDENLTPWMGIYRVSSNFVPRTIGMGSGHRRLDMQFGVLIQESSLKSGEDCEEKLDTHIKNAIDLMLDDPTFKTILDNVTDITVDYLYDRADIGTLYFQSAFIVVNAEVKTG